MRILVITNMYPSASRPAWGTFVKSQVDSLSALGHSVDVMVIDGYRSKTAYLLALPSLWWRVIRGTYDVIHAHYGYCGVIALLQHRLPVVVSFCGDDLLGHARSDGRPSRISLLWVRLHQWLASRFAAVIVKSKEMARLVPRDDVHVIPNGVDMQLFRPRDRADCRRRLGMDDGTVYLLFPSHPANRRKNYAVVEAAARLLNARAERPYRVLCVHDVPHADMPLYMGACDLLVLPSMWEGSPNVIKEAMACDMLVVATPVGDLAELQGVPGFFLTAPDAESVATAIEEAAAYRGPRSGRRAIGHLGLERIALRVSDVLAGARPEGTDTLSVANRNDRRR